MVHKNWKSDPAGRVKNLSLAPNAKNTLFPLFEAVMNSIHAIEERFGKDNISQGKIHIEVIENEGGEYCGFIIDDNGIGFIPENLDSLKRMDSQQKSVIGGKGVGRLLWLKVAEKTRIVSVFQSGSTRKRVEFYFTLPDPIDGFVEEPIDEGEPGTSVQITPYFSNYATSIPKKLETISNRTIAHFVSYFVNISHPNIIVSDSSDSIDLFEAFADNVARDHDYEFKIESIESPFILHCFLVPKQISDDEKSVNALYLGANGRAVTRHELDSVIGMKAIDGKFAFLGYVESEFLDESANETRTSFSLEENQTAKVVDAAKEKVREFLRPEIAKIREKQTKRVEAIRREHPRFLSVSSNPKAFAEELHLSKQSEEEVYVELSREALRTYNRRRNGFRLAVKQKLPNIEKKASEYLSKLKGESISSLAEYVLRRKLILEVFEESLRYKEVEAESSEYENVVHGIICPLKSSTDELNYEDHNLWIIDDRLAFYTYFDSDKRLDQQVTNPDKPLSRPDITLFDLGMGFDSIDKSQPITIIEFKRPKRDDYTLSENPVVQVQNYVESLRKAQQAIKFDGTPLRAIDENTPFMCQIIADITPTLRDVMKRFGGFHQKAGTHAFYKWDSDYRVFIEISSFKEVLDSAKARNQAFFDRLGLI